jgi:hypothetical protein
MPRRRIALPLLAIFLGAGTTLPGPDALLHHWTAAEDSHAHVELPGACTAHTDHCTIGRTASGAGTSIATAPVLRIEPAGSAALILTAAPAIVVLDRGALPQPRAPPAPAV